MLFGRIEGFHCIGKYARKSSEQKQMFKTGMVAMLEEIEPQAVLVHGFMPDSVFGDFKDIVPLYRYASEFERTHIKEGA